LIQVKKALSDVRSAPFLFSAKIKISLFVQELKALIAFCALEKKRQINYHSARLPVCALKPELIARRFQFCLDRASHPVKGSTGFELWACTCTGSIRQHWLISKCAAQQSSNCDFACTGLSVWA